MDIEKTIQWIQETQPDGLEVFITTPLPGSIIYNESISSTKYEGFSREYKGLYFNRLDYSQKQQFHNLNPSEYICEVRTDELTSKDLIQIRNEIEQKFKKMKKPIRIRLATRY